MTFSRQSMFEPAASTSFFMLSITSRACSAKGGFGKGGIARPCSRASRTARENARSEEHTSELQSPDHLVCRLLLEKKKTEQNTTTTRASMRLNIDRRTNLPR